MADVNLDEKDFEILRWLDREGDVDVDELSEQIGISSSTVYYRMEKYREQGIISGKFPQIDQKELGLNLTVISEIKSEYGPGYDKIGEQLSKISGVQTAYFMVGEKSFILMAHLRDHDHLQKYIDDIIHTEGVSHSASHIVLKTFKEEPRLLVNYDDEDIEALQS